MTISDENLLTAFKTQEIDNSSFGHVDHVRVAYQILKEHDFLDATYHYARTIQKLANNAGAPKKFNTTITIAFMSLIAERMAVSQTDTSQEFLEQNSDILEKNVLASRYSTSRISSDLARTCFLMPDTLTERHTP